MPNRVYPPIEDRFWTKVDKRAPTQCWPWIAARMPNGYGAFWNGMDVVGAHRFAYQLLVGPVPEGLQLDHLCRNRACVNPGHLEPVTLRENILRGNGTSAINARKTHCIHGHEFNELNTYHRPKGQREC